MKILPTLPQSVAALLATVLFTVSAHAQGDRWFRVELLVFSHETGSADRAESWEPTPDLSYPDSVRFLIDDAQVKRNIQDIGQDSLLDGRGVQTIKLPLPESELNSRSSTAQQSTDIPRQNPETGGQTSSTDAATAIDAQGGDSVLLPVPFVQRAAAEREFRGKAAYMQRTGNYRTLYHQTWLQPMRDESSALPIVLDRSGDTGEWPALQGSVKVYLSRYLHIETDLWLNTTGNYLPGQWAMPPAPLGPPSLIVIEPEISQPEPLNVTNDRELVSETDTTLEPVYPWRHAVRFTEKRRMRSNEVHYLDHPMLGVVVKFTPVPQEELQAIADADRAALEAAQ
ncbi:MAG: CsiV family protein [Halioglobus sp.]